MKPPNSSKSILLFTTSWEVLKSCPLRRGVDTNGENDENDGDWWLYYVCERGSGTGIGGGFMYVRGGRTQGEDIASGDLQPRFCAREDFATIGKNPREHFRNTSFASVENNNQLHHLNDPLDSNSNDRMLSEGRRDRCQTSKTKSVEILLVGALGWSAGMWLRK